MIHKCAFLLRLLIIHKKVVAIKSPVCQPVSEEVQGHNNIMFPLYRHFYLCHFVVTSQPIPHFMLVDFFITLLKISCGDFGGW